MDITALFENLPGYPGSPENKQYFNGGAGLAVEDESGSAEDSGVLCVDFTDEKTFLSYCDELEKISDGCDFARDTEDALYRSYPVDGKTVYTYYIKCENRARVIVDTVSVPLAVFSGAGKPVCPDTAMMQFGLYYNEMIPGHTCDCGMQYVLRLRDNSIVFVDGGEYEQATDAAVEEAYKRLHELTGTKIGEKMTVSLWFCTHNHNDHMDFFTKMLRLYHDELDVQRVLFNFPSKTLLDYDSVSTDRMKERITSLYPAALFLKPHSGQRFCISDAQFEVITAHEDLLPERFDEERLYRGMNETSTVIKISFENESLLLLADCEERNGEIMLRHYAKSGLSCSYLQAAHHGINEDENIYSFLKFKKVLMPECRYIADKMHFSNQQVLCKYCSYDSIYFAGDCTRVFLLNENSTEMKLYPVVGYHYDGSFV